MYSIDDYDEKGILKPGILLLLAELYVARFMLFGPLSLIASFRPMGTGPSLDLSFLTDVSPFEWFSSIPAVFLLFMLLAKSENSGKWLRGVWHQGAKILAFSVIAQLSIQIIRIADGGSLGMDQFVMGLINLYLVYYFVLGKRPKLVFSMFPEKTQEKSTA